MRIPVLAATFVCSLSAVAQDCGIPFDTPLFGMRSEVGLLYGRDTAFNGAVTELRLNLFKPAGDGQTERPLVVLIHGGGFISGHRDDMNNLGLSLAGMGWAAASISYRMGFHGTAAQAPPHAHDSAEVTRAIHRAMQDARGAIRFLKGRQAQDSTSTTNVLLWGPSAGAITALHVAYLDEPGEKPAACGAIAPVDHIVAQYPRPDLGGIGGTLNQNGHDASVLGIVNLFGALLDTALIGRTAPPALYSYHQTGDPYVSCGRAPLYWNQGMGIMDNYPGMYGSCAMDEQVRRLGFAPERYRFHRHEGDGHFVHDPLTVLLEVLPWMRGLFCPAGTGTPDPRAAPAPRVFPVPSDGVFNVEWPSPNGTTFLRVTDAAGREVLARAATGGRTSLDLRGLPAGTYFLLVVQEGGTHAQRLLLVPGR